MKKIEYILLMFLVSLSAMAQKESANVREGNKLYKSSKYTDAEIAYRKGLLQNPKSFEANFNLGNALYRQKKYPEALEQYNNTAALQPKEKGKIAETKLTFPLVILLLVLVMITIAPAMMEM